MLKSIPCMNRLPRPARMLGVILLLMPVALTLPALSQTSLSGPPEFIETTAGIHTFPRVASDDDGNHVVVWNSATASQILFRRFDAAGHALDAVDRVAVDATEVHDLQVAMAPGGAFAIAWRQASERIKGRLFKPSGAPLAAAFEIDPLIAGFQWSFDVAMDASGSAAFIFRFTGSTSGTQAVVFRSDGTAQQQTFLSPLIAGNSSEPTITLTPAGGLLFANDQLSGTNAPRREVLINIRDENNQGLLTLHDPEPSPTVFLQAFDARAPKSIRLADGRFLVAWDQETTFIGTYFPQIRGRFFGADGTVLGLGSLGTSFVLSSLDALPDGSFVAVATGTTSSTDKEDIYARVFGGVGSSGWILIPDAVGLEDGRVAATGDGFVVVWQTAGDRIRAQRFTIGAQSSSAPWQGLFEPTTEPLGDGRLVACDPFDIDGDGEYEAVIENPAAAPGTVSLSQTGGSGDDVVHVGTAGGGEHVATVDIDGDGDLEAVFTAAAEVAGTLLTASAAGTDPDVVWVGTSGSSVHATFLAAGDFDGDGDADLAFAHSDQAVGGGLSAALDIGHPDALWIGTAQLQGHVIADLDGDGDLELILGEATLAAGTSSTWAPSGADIDVIWAGGEAQSALDLDGDGLAEVLISSGSSVTSAAISGSGPDLVFAPGRFIGSLDLDGDGSAEAIFDDSAVASGTHIATSVVSTDIDVIIVGTSLGGGAAAVVDIDGDGEVELIVEDLTPSASAITTVNLGGTGDDLVILATGGGLITELADVDGDGELEVIVNDAQASAGQVSFASLAGSTDLDIVTAGTLGNSGLAADLDGDGEDEVIIQAPHLAAGATTTTFHDSKPAVVFVGGDRLVGAADLDGDGEVEVAIESAMLSSPTVAADLDSADTDLVFVQSANGERVEWAADVDRDGLRELVVAEPNANYGAISEALPGATDPALVRFGVMMGELAGTVDLDSDGDLEVVAEDPSTSGSTSATYGLDGSSEPALVRLAAENGGAVRCRLDLDCDGEPEVLLSAPSILGGGVALVNIDSADSDAVFAGSGLPAAITLLSPAGGETAILRSFYSITWQACGIAGKISIELARDGGATWELLKEANNTGSWSWLVKGTPSADARIRLTSVQDPSLVAVGATFSIPTPQLQILSPAGGESWPIETLHDITWSMSDIEGPARLELSRDDGVTWELIQDNNPNDGLRGWWVTGPPSTTARIRLSSFWEPAQSVISNAFTIPTPSLTVTAPTAGQVLDIGQSSSITWSMHDLGGPVTLELSRDAGNTWEPLDPETPNDGERAWIPVTGPASANAVLRLRSFNDPSYEATTGIFEIRDPSP